MAQPAPLFMARQPAGPLPRSCLLARSRPRPVRLVHGVGPVHWPRAPCRAETQPLQRRLTGSHGRCDSRHGRRARRRDAHAACQAWTERMSDPSDRLCQRAADCARLRAGHGEGGRGAESASAERWLRARGRAPLGLGLGVGLEVEAATCLAAAWGLGGGVAIHFGAE